MTVREELIELVNKLFIYTDNRDWQRLEESVLADEIYLDMASAGGTAETLNIEQVCEMWQSALETLDAVNHITGNFLVEVLTENFAKVFCYSTATHYNSSAKNGTVREFVGSYDLELTKGENGWRITSLIYDLKYMNGNLDLS